MSAATVTVVYPQGAKFDMEYYKAKHMPLVQEKWGPFGLTSWKVMSFPSDAAYCVQATLEWKDLKSFQTAASSPAAKEVLGDVSNFSDKDPVILAGEIQFSSS
ncbi:uncharacterized protein SEPMUDRAFT_145866 [Sphaerulina musiva SO2202]|uniref:EthD domain-containing protein n=1 Tax=Sphaerulina musiva (strain SO2202) TaxID=692275 RepID=N1QLQ0_SPHMS|nr:uncharacterized protein SEPMUDRAFT_145866 [Sphaerulina musiva SO2202]EMF16668.1 hypothetical protein SEPMUDRAFT_145866 [Sphaerulina musiva SO2202]